MARLLSTRVLFGSALAQTQLTLSKVEDLRPVLTMPLVALISVAVLVQGGKPELASYGLVAAVLMTIGQMGNFVASEIVFFERHEQMLELAVASPASYQTVLFARILMLTSFGVLGALESWILVRFCLGVDLPIYHPGLALVTLAATSFAAAGTALLTTALFALGKQVRTFQNAINGPLYLLGGVLVPTLYLPAWLQPLSPFVFFYWSANLLRDAMAPAAVHDALTGLLSILALGLFASLLGYVALKRMLERMRRRGTLGLV